MRHAIAGLTLALFGSGCLASTYSIPREELERISRLPPEKRGERVRVTQRFVMASEPEPAESRAPVADFAFGVVIVGGGPRERDPARRVYRRSRERHYARPTSVGPSGDGPAPSAPSSGSSSSSGSSGSSGSSNTSSSKPSAADDAAGALAAAALVIGSVFVGTALAVSEGTRFDGWARVSPYQALHLYGENGDIGWVPIGALEPATLAGADRAVISGDEGIVRRLRRAPLDRVGLTYGVELGLAGLSTATGEGALGYGGRMTFGAFPLQELGFLFGASAAVGQKSGATEADFRLFLEADALPLVLGRLHLGLYGQGGRVFADQFVDDRQRSASSWLLGGGLLGQIDLFTRLALVLRAGAFALPNAGDPGDPLLVAPEGSIGIAVY